MSFQSHLPGRARTALALPALLALLPQPAAAAWPSDPTTNVPLCVAPGAQADPDASPDGGGGAIVTWEDQRDGTRDIYVQRVDASGEPRWTAHGVALCAATGEQFEPKIVPDGSGGAIVTWSDFRGATFDIYVQRVDSSGTPLWTVNGVALGAATNDQFSPNLVADGSGGAIVTWEDARSGISRIYAQRVNASGVPQWAFNGVALTNSLSGQAFPVLVSNGAGGAIVAWQDYRNGEVDLFAQRILANGALDPAWPVAGRAVALSWGDQDPPVLTVDGNGGALVAWAQWNGGTRDIFVKHLLASGAIDPAWPVNGRVLIADFYDQASPAIVGDGAGGALVSWDDQRGQSRNIFAQHVLSSGSLDPAWPDTGLAVCLKAGDQVSPRMVSDGAGGAIVTWENLQDDAGDIDAHHMLNSGVVDPAWPADGRAISTASLRQIAPTIVADGAGGAVIAWDDRRNAGESGEDGDIFAQGVKANGQLGEAPVDVPGAVRSALSLEAPIPNPTRTNAMLVRFTLAGAEAASLELFDVAGRRLVARDVGSLGAGPHAIDLASVHRPGPGVYFVRLRQGPGERVQRIVVLDE